MGNGSYKITGSARTLPANAEEAQVYATSDRAPGTVIAWKTVDPDGSFELTFNRNVTEVWIAGAYLDPGWKYSNVVRLTIPQ